MKKANELAPTVPAQARDKQKDYYDLRAREYSIRKGYRVLVKIVSFEGKHKIADRLGRRCLYCPAHSDNSCLRRIQRSGEGRKRTSNRNLLLPIGHMDGFRQRQSKYALKRKYHLL